MADTVRRCPFCAEEIQAAAILCRFCRADLVTRTPHNPTPAPVFVQSAGPSNGVAAVLSLFIPGAGQMYKGHVGSGLLWLIAVVIGYAALIIPGLVLHFLCVIMAASGTPARSSAPVRPLEVEISPARQAAIDASAKRLGRTLASVTARVNHMPLIAAVVVFILVVAAAYWIRGGWWDESAGAARTATTEAAPARLARDLRGLTYGQVIEAIGQPTTQRTGVLFYKIANGNELELQLVNSEVTRATPAGFDLSDIVPVR